MGRRRGGEGSDPARLRSYRRKSCTIWRDDDAKATDSFPSSSSSFIPICAGQKLHSTGETERRKKERCVMRWGRSKKEGKHNHAKGGWIGKKEGCVCMSSS